MKTVCPFSGFRIEIVYSTWLLTMECSRNWNWKRNKGLELIVLCFFVENLKNLYLFHNFIRIAIVKLDDF